MNFIVEKAADIVFNKAVEDGSKKVNNMLEGNKLQKILLQSFEGYRKLEKIKNPQKEPECQIDRKAIMSVDKNMIMPNITMEQLEKNLKNLFDKCITTDNEEKAGSIRKIICYNYKNGVSDLVTISQIDEDIHKVYKTVLEKTNEISGKLDREAYKVKEIDQGVKEINRKLKMEPQQQIIFNDELDNSRMFCYISLKLSEDIDEDYLAEISSNIFAEWDDYKDESGITNVNFNFYEPIVQNELKEYLKYIDEEFSENNIGIFGITSHF